MVSPFVWEEGEELIGSRRGDLRRLKRRSVSITCSRSSSNRRWNEGCTAVGELAWSSRHARPIPSKFPGHVPHDRIERQRADSGVDLGVRRSFRARRLSFCRACGDALRDNCELCGDVSSREGVGGDTRREEEGRTRKKANETQAVHFGSGYGRFVSLQYKRRSSSAPGMGS